VITSQQVAALMQQQMMEQQAATEQAGTIYTSDQVGAMIAQGGYGGGMPSPPGGGMGGGMMSAPSFFNSGPQMMHEMQTGGAPYYPTMQAPQVSYAMGSAMPSAQVAPMGAYGNAATSAIGAAPSVPFGFGEAVLGDVAFGSLTRGIPMPGIAGTLGFVGLSMMDPTGTGGMAPAAAVAGAAGVLGRAGFGSGKGLKGLATGGWGAVQAAMGGGEAGAAALGTLGRSAMAGAGWGAVAYLGYEAANRVVQWTGENLMGGSQQFQSMASMISDPMRTDMPNYQGSLGEAGQSLGMMRNMARNDPTITTNQLVNVAGGMMAGGEFRHVESAREFQEEFKKKLDAMKSISSMLNTTLEEAQGFMQMQKSMGFFGDSGVQNIAYGRGMAMAGGVSAQTMMQGGATGASMARSMGIKGKYGAVGMESTIGMVGYAERMGIMSEEDLSEITGGLTGEAAISSFSQRMMGYGLQFSRSSKGRRLAAALMDPETGHIDPMAARSYGAGEMDFDEVQRRARANLGTREGALAWKRHSKQLSGEMLEQIGPMGMIGQDAEQMLDKAFGGRTMLSYQEQEHMTSMLQQRYTGMSGEEATMVTNMAKQGPRLQYEVKQEMSRAMSQMENQASAVMPSWDSIKSMLYRKFVDPIKETIQSQGADLMQGIASWLNDEQGIVQYNVSSSEAGAMRSKSMGMGYMNQGTVLSGSRVDEILKSEPGMADLFNATTGGGMDGAIFGTKSTMQQALQGPQAGFGTYFDFMYGSRNQMINPGGQGGAAGAGNILTGGAGNLTTAFGATVEASMYSIGNALMPKGQQISAWRGGVAGRAQNIGSMFGGIGGALFDEDTRMSMAGMIDPATGAMMDVAASGFQIGGNLAYQQTGMMGRQMDAIFGTFKQGGGSSDYFASRAGYVQEGIKWFTEDVMGGNISRPPREYSEAEMTRFSAMLNPDEAIKQVYGGTMNRAQWDRNVSEVAIMSSGVTEGAAGLSGAYDMGVNTLRGEGYTGGANAKQDLIARRAEIQRRGGNLGFIDKAIAADSSYQAAVEYGASSRRGGPTAMPEMLAVYDKAMSQQDAILKTDPGKYRRIYQNRMAGMIRGERDSLTATPAEMASRRGLGEIESADALITLFDSGIAVELANMESSARHGEWKNWLTKNQDALEAAGVDYATMSSEAMMNQVMVGSAFAPAIALQEKEKDIYRGQYRKFKEKGDLSSLRFFGGGSDVEQSVLAYYQASGIEGVSATGKWGDLAEKAKGGDSSAQMEMDAELVKIATDDPDAAKSMARVLEQQGDAVSLRQASILVGSPKTYKRLERTVSRGKGKQSVETERDVAELLITGGVSEAVVNKMLESDVYDLREAGTRQLLVSSLKGKSGEEFAQYLNEAMRDGQVTKEELQSMTGLAANAPPKTAGTHTSGGDMSATLDSLGKVMDSQTALLKSMVDFKGAFGLDEGASAVKKGD